MPIKQSAKSLVHRKGSVGPSGILCICRCNAYRPGELAWVVGEMAHIMFLEGMTWWVLDPVVSASIDQDYHHVCRPQTMSERL